MAIKSEPWYIHLILYVVIAVLVFILVQVAIIQPAEIVEKEEFYQKESRLRMKNIKEAEILWNRKYNRFTNDLDSLISFIKNDPSVVKVITGVDSLTNKKTNPFEALISTNPVEDTLRYFTQVMPDSLKKSPKSFREYILQIDTSVQADTVINQSGKILRVDTTRKIGTRYYLEDPDGYGTIGDLYQDALKNTASWE